MRRLMILSLLSIFLVGCGPTVTPIESAESEAARKKNLENLPKPSTAKKESGRTGDVP